MGQRVVAVAVAHDAPVIHENACRFPRSARSRPIAVILQPHREVVEWLAIVSVNLVQLGEREPIAVLPRRALIPRPVHAAVVDLPHELRIRRIDPHRVVIAMHIARHATEVAATVDGHRELAADHVHAIRIRRIDSELAVICAAAHQWPFAVHGGPGLPPIVAAKEHAVVGFDRRVHRLRMRGGHLHADAPRKFGQSFGHLLPGPSAVAGAIDAAQRVTAREGPLFAIVGPNPGVQHVRVARVEVKVGAAVAVVRVQDFRPRIAPVYRHEDAALGVGSRLVSNGADVDHVVVARTHQHAGDVSRVAEPNVLPRRTAIGRLVDAVAERNRVPHRGFARAGVDHVRIAGFKRDVAN